MLPRFYKDEPTREREVALYIDGKYLTRGPASTGRRAARYGWDGGSETVAPSRLTWELDRTPGTLWGDRPMLTWGNEQMNSEQFLAWLEAA
jgi:hypothetical protein